MTIIARNRLIKSGIAAASLFSVFSIAVFVLLCINQNRNVMEETRRLIPFPENLLFGFNFYAVCGAVLVLAIAGALTLLRIYFLFEKTPSIEITFFSAGLIAVSAECVRLAVPLYMFWETQPFIMVIISRAVLFARTFFVLAFVAGAVFSLEKKFQQSGIILFFIAAISFLSARNIPINFSEPNALFFMEPGYSSLIVLIIALLLLIAFFSFLIQAKAHNSPEYYKTSAGCFCITAGWLALSLCDNWFFLAAGTILFFAGTSLYLHSLHRYYLWQ